MAENHLTSILQSLRLEFSRVLGDHLIDAHDLRNLGDYGISPGITDSQIQELLRWAEEFISVAENLLSSLI